MTLIDQFESVFKSSVKPIYQHTPIVFESVWLLTDGDQDEAQQDIAQLDQIFLDSFGRSPKDWTLKSGTDSQFAGGLVKDINEAKPDLICTWRNLHSKSSQWPYSLGENVEILTQATKVPVLVLPRKEETRLPADWVTHNVLALTNHLEEDVNLVNYAVAATASGGTLYLSHLEDDAVFERYMQVIEKIPGIDSVQARETIRAKLLGQAQDFIDACIHGLQDVAIEVEPIVRLGHTIRDHVKVVQEHQIDLLVLNTKDDDQIAMHGSAYPLAVELSETPTLLL